MSIFMKTKKTEVIAPLDEGMTYTQLVSQELDTEVNRLGKVEKELTKGVEEVLGAIKEKGGHSELTSIVAKLRQKLDKNAEELKQANLKYRVDPGLTMMAGTLDRADGTNKGIDLLHEIGLKVNEILAMLPEVERCYGSEYYSPILFTQIKKGLEGMAMQFNNEMPKLHRVDKKALAQKLNDRLEALGEKKVNNHVITDKYKDL